MRSRYGNIDFGDHVVEGRLPRWLLRMAGTDSQTAVLEPHGESATDTPTNPKPIARTTATINRRSVHVLKENRASSASDGEPANTAFLSAPNNPTGTTETYNYAR